MVPNLFNAADRSTFENFATYRQHLRILPRTVQQFLYFAGVTVYIYIAMSMWFLFYSFLLMRVKFQRSSDRDVTWKIKNLTTQIVNKTEIIKYTSKILIGGPASVRGSGLGTTALYDLHEDDAFD